MPPLFLGLCVNVVALKQHKIIAKCLINWFRYILFRNLGLCSKPSAITIEYTNRCIARCIMCNIWKAGHNSNDLDNAQWLKILKEPFLSDLIELDITGGEPFIRDDIKELLITILRMKTETVGNLQTIAITTNGILVDRIISCIQALMEEIDNKKVDLVIACALDFIGPTHDRIRRYKGAWSLLNQTLEKLVRLRESSRRLILGIKTTILPENSKNLDEIFRFCKDRDLFLIISPFIITKARYMNIDLGGSLTFSEDDKKEIIQFYRRHKIDWAIHSDNINKYLIYGAVRRRCSCGFNYFFIRANGKLLLCPLIDISPGNALDTDVSTLLHSSTSKEFRKRIGSYEMCKKCTEPGLERYSLAYTGIDLIKFWIRNGKKDLAHLLIGSGIAKYFS